MTHRIPILIALLVTACGSGDESDSSGGKGKDAGKGDSGAVDGASDAGTGTGGDAGSAGVGGADGGTAGTGALGGQAGASGSAGNAGAGGSAGSSTGGSAGSSTGGSAGSGVGGNAGSGVGGNAGSGGTGGSSGADAAAGGVGGNIAGAGGTAGGGGAPGCLANVECDNGSYCDGVEACIGGQCVPGTPVTCPDDGKTCTFEICEESSQSCKTVFDDQSCNNPLFCDGVEKCEPLASGSDPLTGCVAGIAPVCDDGTACTTDGCDESNDSCAYTPNDAFCDDGQFCTGGETCAPGAQGALANGCLLGQPVQCEDGVGCTNDSCSETSDQCVHQLDATQCDDGLHCNGAEVCTAAGCAGGSPPACPGDGIPCTVEACDEASNQCQTTPTNALCNPGQICVPGQGCVVVACTNNAGCDDGNACNGAETCNTSVPGGTCVAGTPVDCNDSLDCTLDECTPATGACTHSPLSATCQDGDLCNGVETCSVALGCVAGTPLSCNDGVDCTQDSCIPSLGCISTPSSNACQDGLTCNGIEICHLTQGCLPATAPAQCPGDGIACTIEACVEGVGCVSTPNDALCACQEACVPALGGCGKFCTPATCQGKTYQCGDCLDNDGDCKVDASDQQCLGACSNNEAGFKGDIPGQNNAPCKMDCYFDQDTGSGNDDCYWSHKCDPHEVAPNYPPSGSQCAYDPNANVPGSQQSCAQLSAAQSALCGSYCGPLVPNGCDCFGCCAIPGAPTTVYLGSEDSGGNGTCNLNTLGDPSKCKPCAQVPACLNTCDICEICVGKPTLPPGCSGQSCPPGDAPCGLGGQAACPDGKYCVTGCCQPVPQ